MASYLAKHLIKRGGLGAMDIINYSQRYARGKKIKHPMEYARRNLERVRGVLIEHGARSDGNGGVML